MEPLLTGDKKEKLREKLEEILESGDEQSIKALKEFVSLTLHRLKSEGVRV